MTKDEINKKSKIGRIDLEDWQKKLGPELFANIIRVLVGINRIYSLWSLMIQTAQSEVEVNKARSARNRSTSFALLSGVLQALSEVLSRLSKATKTEHPMIADRVRDITNIFKENPLRSLLARFRKKIAFHIDEDVIKTGLELTKEKIIDFVDFDSGTHADIYYRFAENVSLQGLFGLYCDDVKSLSANEFDNYYKDRLKEYIEYILDVQTQLVEKVDMLLDALVVEYKLKITEAD